MARNDSSKDKKASPPAWEWVLAAVGVILVGTAVGSAFYRALTHEDTPPQIEVGVSGIKTTAGGFDVEFEVRNAGGHTAAELNLEAQLLKSGEPVETSTATLAYSPSNSVRRGGIFFTNDPKAFELKIRALGYESP